jgi:hypothetical protein
MPYTINGTSRSDIPDPVMTDGTTFVPVGMISDLLGGYVYFDNMTKVATIEMGNRKARLQADSTEVEIDGQMESLQAAPYIDNNTMWVPVRFFSNQLGINMNAEGNNITLSRDL